MIIIAAARRDAAARNATPASAETSKPVAALGPVEVARANALRT